MKKNQILATFIILIALPLGALNNPEVDEAIRLAYNFQFIASEAALDDYQRRNPEDLQGDRKSTRLNSSHIPLSRMPSSA